VKTRIKSPSRASIGWWAPMPEAQRVPTPKMEERR
jgi:hypothetical protein